MTEADLPSMLKTTESRATFRAHSSTYLCLKGGAHTGAANAGGMEIKMNCPKCGNRIGVFTCSTCGFDLKRSEFFYFSMTAGQDILTLVKYIQDEDKKISKDAEEAVRRQHEMEEDARKQREAEEASRRQREAGETARRQRETEEAAQRRRGVKRHKWIFAQGGKKWALRWLAINALIVFIFGVFIYIQGVEFILEKRWIYIVVEILYYIMTEKNLYIAGRKKFGDDVYDIDYGMPIGDKIRSTIALFTVSFFVVSYFPVSVGSGWYDDWLSSMLILALPAQVFIAMAELLYFLFNRKSAA